MRKKRFTILDMLLAGTCVALLTVVAMRVTAWFQLGPGGIAVLQSERLVHERFVGEFDRDGAVDATLDAMVASLGDRWSLYLTPEEYQSMLQTRENAYVGVGLTYQLETDPLSLRIVDLNEDGPALAGGLQVGDRIVAIGGQTLTEDNVETLVATLGGETGREVVLTVLDAQNARRSVRLTTAKVETFPVRYELREDGIGYVRLFNFYDGSAQRFTEAVDDLVDRGAAAILFDVRNNPGGYVSELTKMLDRVLPEGPIFAERSKAGSTHVTQSDERCVDLPMAVLINADSYSAAELFAAQLRESVDAPLVGVQTCGKGYYQQVFKLKNGGALNLSTGMYTTGGGTSLIGVGLTPDVTETDEAIQLERAAALLLEKVG